MTRNLKVLVLGLLAMAAMAAMAAPAASGLEFTAGTNTKGEDKFFDLDGKSALGDEEFEAFGGKTLCASSVYTGTQTLPSSTVSVIPHYTGCTAIGFAATITSTQCTYVFHVEKATEGGGADAFEGKVDIVCPPTEPLAIHIYLSEGDHTNNSSLCTITIPNQTVTGVHYKVDTGTPHDITVTAVTGAIHGTIHRNSILCPKAKDGSTTETAGKYTINKPVTVQATHHKEAKLVDTWID